MLNMSVHRKELQRQRVDCKAHIDIASRLIRRHRAPMYITINMDDYLGQVRLFRFIFSHDSVLSAIAIINQQLYRLYHKLFLPGRHPESC